MRIPHYELLSKERLVREKCPVCWGVSKSTRRQEHASWNQCETCNVFWDPDSFLGHSDVRLRDDPTVPEKWATSHRIERVLAAENPENQAAQDAVASWHWQWKAIAEQIKDAAGVDVCASARSLLEVGFGAGEILDYTRKHLPHAKSVGFEVDADAVAFTRSRGHDTYLFDLSSGRGSQSLSPGTKFDVIYANEVMEHVLDPQNFVRRLRDYAHQDTFLWLKFAHPYIEELDWGEWYYWPLSAASRLLENEGWDIRNVRRMPTSFSFVAKPA